jgi:hypothetical protein
MKTIHQRINSRANMLNSALASGLSKPMFLFLASLDLSKMMPKYELLRPFKVKGRTYYN